MRFSSASFLAGLSCAQPAPPLPPPTGAEKEKEGGGGGKRKEGRKEGRPVQLAQKQSHQSSSETHACMYLGTFFSNLPRHLRNMTVLCSIQQPQWSCLPGISACLLLLPPPAAAALLSVSLSLSPPPPFFIPCAAQYYVRSITCAASTTEKGLPPSLLRRDDAPRLIMHPTRRGEEREAGRRDALSPLLHGRRLGLKARRARRRGWGGGPCLVSEHNRPISNEPDDRAGLGGGDSWFPVAPVVYRSMVPPT